MKQHANSWQKYKYPYLFIAPAILLLTVFSILPIIIALVISFTDMDLVGLADYSNIQGAGFTNYLGLFKDPVFIKSIVNTGIYVVIGVPLVILFAMTAALLLNYGTSWLFNTFRVVYYLPSITNIVAVAVVWGYLYNSNYGLFNYILSWFGLPAQQWLQDPMLAKLSLILMAVWKSIGLNMIIFLAALQGIPRSYYEAAEIDGATGWKKLRFITIPLLSFATFFVTITTLIGWIQFFEEPLVMTKGGPLNGTMSMALFIYNNGFKLSDFGYAASGSFVLFIIIIIATIVQFLVKRKEVEY
ncbi:carbohydrate ABC transporter membrane protein 1 (CUT1 family) [Fontibacillus phaseoli]|uniref:Carbohydrate ABC transporter membrane protein 1 (CUT1 family) n=1 Tax=Fontibacillus phaseoli TaxID=1416533 RepID=A0A369BFU0_9BACL|nr:sugar ABC transporter permease [Fontibacillus phaseoli]RCX18564.1 carbohydrate ABC transporter membrane protein 1 (CUT1 family) [Fontibacillus phaseoli]